MSFLNTVPPAAAAGGPPPPPSLQPPPNYQGEPFRALRILNADFICF